MNHYKHVLLALDLHPECDKGTADRAVEIAKDFNAKLSIVHAIEHINAYGVAQAYPTVMDLEEQLIKEAQIELNKWGQQLGVSSENLYLEVGSPKIVILKKAEEIGADLIVVGSHGRHGLNLLLGSTANAVLHHAPCDVLAVRVSEQSHKHK